MRPPAFLHTRVSVHVPEGVFVCASGASLTPPGCVHEQRRSIFTAHQMGAGLFQMASAMKRRLHVNAEPSLNENKFKIIRWFLGFMTLRGLS